MESHNSKPQNLIAFGTIAFYILFRMVGDSLYWREVSVYYAYAFEVAFVAVAYFLFRKDIILFNKLSKTDIVTSVASVLLGFLIYKAASFFGIFIPFEFSSGELVFLLLIVAPILEEAIFRMALWQPFQVFLQNGKAVIVVTTILFAAGHFASYWFVPEEFQGFILYQSVYVLLLGALAGWRRFASGSVAPAVLVHFGFNFGFYCASF